MSNFSKRLLWGISLIIGMGFLDAKGETAAVNGPITYSTLQVISKDDSASIIVEKASNVKVIKVSMIG